jgi:hypothetical protein
VAQDFAISQTSTAEFPAALRARAERVRALARAVAHDVAAETLRKYADELDQKAATFEAGT